MRSRFPVSAIAFLCTPYVTVTKTMTKLQPINNESGETVGYMFYCPGCKSHHAPYIKPHQSPNSATWEFNGDLEHPTFHPSILVRWSRSDGKTMVCHSFVTDGEIRFLSDCTHQLAGQTVEIPDIS
jgi:Family of unknown function (DUF6527)